MVVEPYFSGSRMPSMLMLGPFRMAMRGGAKGAFP
jgi:hypothetical protein